MTTEQIAAVQTWATVVSAVATGASAVLAGVLALLTGVYVFLTNRLAEASRTQTSGSAHERLYNQNHALLDVIATYPATRPYFYSERPLSDCPTDEDRHRVLIIAEMYAGFMEQIALHLTGLPTTVRGQWRQFIQDAYRLSPAVQTYFRDFGYWYSPVLLDLLPPGAASPLPGAQHSPNQPPHPTAAQSNDCR